MPDEEMATEEKPETAELSEEEQAQAKLKEAILVEVEELGTLRKKLTITVPQATVDERRNDQFGEIKRDAVVPGFRKGHAPLRLVEKRFGHDVNDQLCSQLLSSSYLAAVEKQELKTIGDPLIWAKDKKAGDSDTEKLVSFEEALDLLELPTGGDLSYSCEVELRPEFDLPELAGLKIKKPRVTIGQKEIQEYIDRLRAARGRYEPVAQGKIEEDDLVVCRIRVSVDDKVLLEEENCQLAARPMSYGGLVLEDLGKALAGAGVGEKRQVSCRVPDDYRDESVRGRSAQAELEVLDIKRLILPDIDADFLGSVGCETEEELRGWAKGSLESYRHDTFRRKQREQVHQYLLEQCQFEVPQRLSQQQANRIAARRMLELAHRGVPDSEIMKQADAIRSGAQRDAGTDLKLQFILERFAEEWKVQVSEDELNGQIAAIAQRQNRRFDRVRDELIRSKTINSLHFHVRDQKIVDRIIEEAAGAATEESEDSTKERQ